jgi:Fic family protein
MERKYLKTHPWIDFSLDTRQADIFTWLLLGEAQSKCKHIAGTLLDPKIAQDLHIVYLAKGALATTAIEGNTLSEEQVRAIIDKKLELPPSKRYLQREVENIVTACNKIFDEQMEKGATPISVEEIAHYNLAVLDGLKLPEGVVPGKIRRHSVGVGRYLGAPQEDCEYLLSRLCAMLEGDFSLGEHWSYATGILRAVLAHLYIAWIHPFGDGNGRTARLLEFKLCVSAGIPAPAAHLLSNHYNETRADYYLTLDETSRKKSPFPFIKYALQGYVDQLGEQIQKIREAQHRAFWTNYVHTKFQEEKESSANTRREHLMLDISERIFNTTEPWVRVSDLPRISTRVQQEYRGKTLRAMSRDVRILEKMGLLLKKGFRVGANIESLAAYLPRKVPV